ncbi:MAG: hypothetical protein WCG26_02870 [Chloroflexales bacterium]
MDGRSVGLLIIVARLRLGGLTPPIVHIGLGISPVTLDAVGMALLGHLILCLFVAGGVDLASLLGFAPGVGLARSLLPPRWRGRTPGTGGRLVRSGRRFRGWTLDIRFALCYLIHTRMLGFGRHITRLGGQLPSGQKLYTSPRSPLPPLHLFAQVRWAVAVLSHYYAAIVNRYYHHLAHTASIYRLL